MALFELAVEVVLEHEGFSRFTNDPADPGGPTKWGVSLRYLRSLPRLAGDIDGDLDVDVDDIRALTRKKAVELVYKPIWRAGPYAKIKAQAIATKAFDLTVNMGARRVRKVRGATQVVGGAHLALQRACRAAGAPLVEDGLLGPISIKAINSVPVDMLLAAYRSEAAAMYRRIGNRRFLTGWLNRAYS